MSSNLDVKGIYDPTKRFAFTNITEEEFVSKWDGSPITVKSGVTVELPHHLAVKMTRELVDKIMIGEAKIDELKNADKPFYRSPKGMSLGVPAARQPYEEAILRELAVDEESPQLQIMRAQIRQEILADLNKEPASGAPAIPTSLQEFAELGKKTEEAPKKAMKLPEIEKPKRGRPKNEATDTKPA